MLAETASRPERSVWSLPAFASTFIPLVAFLPSAQRAALAPRIAIGLITGAVGLPILVRLVVARDRAAMAAAALLGWGALSAAFSRTWLSWSGAWVHGTGAVFLLTLGGYWALGRLLPEDAKRFAVAGFVAGAVLNALVAMAQGPWDLETYQLPLYDARSTGLFANPLYLGAAAATAVALLPLLARTRPWTAVGTVFLLMCGTQMSGGRVAIALAVAVGVWGAVRIRGLAGAAFVIAIALGLGAGAVLPENQQETAAQRLNDPGKGLDSRLRIWEHSLDAARTRPLLGYGPGRFLAATSARETLEQARIDGPDRLYFEGHNLVTHYAATVGFAGVVLLGAWLVLAARAAKVRSHPEFVVAAVILFAVHLLEPQNVVLTPLMFMLLGAAAAPAKLRHRAHFLHWIPVVVATALGAVVVLGDVQMRSAVLDGDLEQARTAARLLRPWAEPIHAETLIHVYQGTVKLEDGTDAARRRELMQAGASARRAVRRESDDWRLHAELGGVLRRLGDDRGAAAAYAAALRRNPWSHLGLAGRAIALDALDQPAQAAACRELDGLIKTDEPARRVPELQRACFG